MSSEFRILNENFNIKKKNQWNGTHPAQLAESHTVPKDMGTTNAHFSGYGTTISIQLFLFLS